MSEPSTALSFSFAYNEPEDRIISIVKTLENKNIALLITRRLASRLINGLAAILETSSSVANRAPANMRGDIILLEHQGAKQSAASSTESVEAAPQWTSNEPEVNPDEPVPLHLVTSVDTQTLPTHFDLTAKGAQGSVIKSRLNRNEMHLFIDVLTRHANAADWNISTEAEWLEPGQTNFSIN